MEREGSGGMPGDSPESPQGPGRRGYRSEGREPASGYCQRCKGGVTRPEQELKRCPSCARDVCAECRVYESDVEAHICIDCRRQRRSARRARARSARYLLLLSASALAVIVGRVVALRTGWTWAYMIGALVCAAGIVAYAWQVGFHHTCPYCEGRAKVLGRKGRFLEFECQLCRQVWME